jgi:hypothetical protein
MLSDKRRPLPPYAIAFCEMLTAFVREVFPITRPSEPKTDLAAKRDITVKARTQRSM